VIVGPSIPSPDCCNGAAAPCALGNYPCVWSPSVQTIVPQQHYFSQILQSFSFTGVMTSTSTIDLFLHDLHPSNSYDFFIDSTTKFTVQAGIPTVGFFYYQLTGVSAGSHTICVEISGNGQCGASTPTVNATNPPSATEVPTNPTFSPAPTAPTTPPAPTKPTTNTPTTSGVKVELGLQVVLAFVVLLVVF